MKITLIKHNRLFPFHEESWNVPETDFHENPRWPPRWPPYEPHGTRFDLGNTKILALDNITIIKM